MLLDNISLVLLAVKSMEKEEDIGETAPGMMISSNLRTVSSKLYSKAKADSGGSKNETGVKMGASDGALGHSKEEGIPWWESPSINRKLTLQQKRDKSSNAGDWVWNGRDYVWQPRIIEMSDSTVLISKEISSNILFETTRTCGTPAEKNVVYDKRSGNSMEGPSSAPLAAAKLGRIPLAKVAADQKSKDSTISLSVAPLAVAKMKRVSSLEKNLTDVSLADMNIQHSCVKQSNTTGVIQKQRKSASWNEETMNQAEVAAIDTLALSSTRRKSVIKSTRSPAFADNPPQGNGPGRGNCSNSGDSNPLNLRDKWRNRRKAVRNTK